MTRLLLVALLVFAPAALLLTPAVARASPEDALLDGDIDAEDLALHAGQRVSPRGQGSAALSLVGFARENEVGGLVVLALPFDRFMRGGTRTTSVVRTSMQASAGNGTAPESAPPFDIALSPRLARACVSAAWSASGLGADDSRLDAIVSRARWSALLPETRLRAIKYDSASLYSSLDPLGTPTYFRDTTGGNLGLEARLTWRLDRLVYADDEPAIERIRLDQRDARSRIAAKALELLFHWQRASLDLRTLPPSQVGTRDEADVVLRIMEAEASLDVITNGWFSAHKPRRGVSSSI
ncbi:MAG: hypothetical protein U0270_45170 [Labilithrix sp.]